MNTKFTPKMLRPGMNQQIQVSKDAIDSAVEMRCINEIPIDAKPGEFMQCGGEVFVEAHRLKYISAIMSPTGQKTVATINIGKLCIICGKIFNPDKWMKQHDEMEAATMDIKTLKEDKKADG
jgi:hypothetical protein